MGTPRSAVDGIASKNPVVACSGYADVLLVWQDDSGGLYSRLHLVCDRSADGGSNWGASGSGPLYGMDEGKGWTGGESAVGNPDPSSTYFLAEGTTISNFDTWYSLLNPRDDRSCTVYIEYVFGDGSTHKAEYGIAPHSRLTINVRDAVNRQADVSGSITASFPIVIERPIYFNYKNAITGGHDVCGYGVD